MIAYSCDQIEMENDKQQQYPYESYYWAKIKKIKKRRMLTLIIEVQTSHWILK